MPCAWLLCITRRERKNMAMIEAYPIAFSETVIFKLSDMTKLYKECLEQLGVESQDVNSARLKEKPLSHIMQLEAHRPGQDVFTSVQK